MTVWAYQAIDATGQTQKGRIEAASLAEARTRLRQQGLLASQIQAAQAAQAASSGVAAHRHTQGILQLKSLTKRISNADLTVFARQFATLLRAGLTVEQTLSALQEQTEADGLRQAIAALREDILGGHGLGHAFVRQTDVFPRHYGAIIEAAETAGALPLVMERLADEQEASHALRTKVTLALTYPAIVSLVAVGVIGFLLAFVVPQVVSVFARNEQALPALTQVMIALSGFIIATWWFDILLLAVLAVVGYLALQREAVRLRWHAWLLGLPIIGSLRTALATARFARTMAILVGSSVAVPRALEQAGAALDDRVFSQAVSRAALRVKEGVAVHRALAETGVFPGILTHLVASGEASGELARTFEQAGIQQTRQVEARLAVLTALLEPILILIMGGAVLLIVLATLEPLIEMNRILK